jgi:hypothetical protein
MEPEEFYRMKQRSGGPLITRADFDAAAAELANPNSKVDPAILMSILRKDMTRSYEALMAPFLKVPNYRIALDALIYICLEYGQTARYIDDILRFMRGVPSDSRDGIRRYAISIAGGYLNEAHNTEVLRELINIAENETDKRIREEAYQALFKALGHNGPPYGERDINDERERDYEALGPGIVQEANQRLKREEADQKRQLDG